MIVGIARSEQFSPNSVDKDMAVLNAVMKRLNGGVTVREQDFIINPVDADVYVSMARMPQTLELLKRKENASAVVLNSPHGVELCRRSRLEHLMRSEGIPLPPQKGKDGYWIKRGDASAQSRDDVAYCRNEAELDAAKRLFELRGVTDYVISAHVQGDLVKFYGVEGMDFFRVYYPCDDGISKFGDEERNGTPRHYVYDREKLRATAERLSHLVHTPIYGGDAIITPDGGFCVIDFNDWPSFSRCMEEAADAIAGLVTSII